MELKVVSITDTGGNGKQVIMEWWSYNLIFKGVDVRFTYDSTKLTPSSVQDNSVVTDSNGEDAFEFVDELADYMGYFTLSVEDGEYRCIMSLDEYDETCKYVENIDGIGYAVNTNVDGGVLIGRMSFKLIGDSSLSNDTFALKAGTSSPTTGVKISQTSSKGYTDPPVFRFSVLSNDATLKEISYDFFNYNEDDGLMPTLNYTNIDMTNQDSDSTDELQKYTLTLNEMKENISLSIVPNDNNATVKIDGTEIDISKTKELVLNSLGSGDTEIEIEVTAQDEATVQKYKLVVHRPFGTIKGSVEISPTRNKGENIATVRVYDENEVSKVIDWTTIVSGTADTLHDDLIALNSQDVQTNIDGTYEIYVIPGIYDILLDKPGYMDHIFKQKQVNNGDVIDLGERELFAGDVNKDGNIQLQDLALILNVFGIDNADINYDIKYDFNEDENIQLQDYTLTLNNFAKSRVIE